MKLVVGLGNPGARYARTRHNVGARIVEQFARESRIELSQRRFGSRFGAGRLARDSETAGEPRALEIGALVPQTYMNRSGVAVAEALRALGIEDARADLLIAVDDLDLPFGKLRIRPRGGLAGHRGLEDIAERIGTSDFARLRFGIGRPDADCSTVDWVLEPFSADEEAALPERIALAAQAISAILLEGVTAAMNRYNRDPGAAGS
jgi:PTH1 family peptidyl-tRNA hydrolase